MCELCDLRDRTEKLYEEQVFRYQQLQIELRMGRTKAAKKVEDRLGEIQAEIISNLHQRQKLEDEGVGMGGVLKDILENATIN